MQELQKLRILADQQMNSSPILASVNEIKNEFETWFKSIEGDFYNKLETLYNNFTENNVMDFSNWMHNKSLGIVKVLNMSPEPNKKGFLDNLYNLWNQLTRESIIDASINYYIDNVLFNGSDKSTNLLSKSTLSPSATSLSPSVSTTSTPSTSNSLISTVISEIVNTTFNISNTSDTQNLATMLTPLTTTETPVTSTSDTTPLIPIEKTISEACTGFFCGSTPAIAFSVPLGIIGGLLLFVYLYKNNRIRSWIGKRNIKNQKAKKRLRETEMVNVGNTSDHSEETGERKVKRSRLESFLRAFGYYKKFPYVDEDVPGSETIL